MKLSTDSMRNRLRSALPFPDRPITRTISSAVTPAVPGHESVVAEGTYKGMTVTELIDRFGGSLLGERIMERYGGKFPLLVKLIDANDNLSVQVHPDDKLAKSRHDSLGKTEMWY
ncbi:MAG: hypothetical protein K2L00_02125, partial [Muribaculaceae bacterium]|nr:hypothetical protein [Muribaculaceae bacterium]